MYSAYTHLHIFRYSFAHLLLFIAWRLHKFLPLGEAQRLQSSFEGLDFFSSHHQLSHCVKNAQSHKLLLVNIKSLSDDGDTNLFQHNHLGFCLLMHNSYPDQHASFYHAVHPMWSDSWSFLAEEEAQLKFLAALYERFDSIMCRTPLMFLHPFFLFFSRNSSSFICGS